MAIDNNYKKGLSWVVNEVIKDYRAIGKHHDSLFYHVLVTETIYKYDEVYDRLKPAYEKRNYNSEEYLHDLIGRYVVRRMRSYILNRLNKDRIY